MFFSVTRKFTFDAAHRLLNHEGKCRHLHGHRYEAHVTCSIPKLDKQGMVVDFSVIKELIGGWINMAWDHNAILHPEDLLIQDLTASGAREPARLYWDGMGQNPTVENLARFLYRQSQVLMKNTGIVIANVRIWETENCYADYKE